MPEIDIDKILEKKEKMEEEAKKRNKIVLISSVIVGVILLGLISFFVIDKILGEKSKNYFPFKPGTKIIYNKKNMNPEEWIFMDKTENIGNYECKILNIEDKGNFSNRQEYYFIGKKEGIVRLAISNNFGKKTKVAFRLLPQRIKKGLTFTAGKEKDKIIEGKIENKETLSLPVGVVESYKVSYTAPPYIDEVIWFAKDIGVVKKVDNIRKIELNLIDMESK